MDLSQHKRIEDATRHELRFGGNLEKPPEARAAVHYLPVSTKEMKKIRKHTPTPKGSDPVKQSEAFNLAVVRSVIQQKIVAPFENLFAEPGKPIKSAEELLQAIDE